jgi:hypothetical protein
MAVLRWAVRAPDPARPSAAAGALPEARSIPTPNVPAVAAPRNDRRLMRRGAIATNSSTGSKSIRRSWVNEA